MTTMLEAALEYLERGWSVIPVHAGTKKPAVKWQEYQERYPEEDEIRRWWEQWPDAQLGVVTGALSGIVVVDCDSDEAIKAADAAGMHSPIMAKTKRGHHRYFAHPRDGIRRGPRAGSNSRGSDWPAIPGLDFRGDGSYALVPPSQHYSWDYSDQLDWDEVIPTWQDWHPSAPAGEYNGFGALDLSGIKPLDPGELLTEWERTAEYVRANFPNTLKIPTGLGNARNERVMRYLSECVREGVFGEALVDRGRAFMREFYEDALPDKEFLATAKSMEDAERRNHPERFDDDGNYIAAEPKEEKKPARKLLVMADAEQMLAEANAVQYLIDPWLPPGSIVQVYGYSGHGKSLFLQHALGALCAGKPTCGPFEVPRQGRVLYLDFEMGRATIARRLLELREVHGDTGDRLQIWTPFIGTDMNLRQREGIEALKDWIRHAKPDVLVIDTVRSAYPGLVEKDANEWASINKLALSLRNSGIAVVLVHHANKPGDGGLGLEAGSTNQLTVLETQIRVLQVHPDKATAKQLAAQYDGDYETPVWPLLEAKTPATHRLSMVVEVRYGKVREWTDAHDRVQWIGFAQHNQTGERMIVSSSSTRQRARTMALGGSEPEVIARSLDKPTSVIRQWIGALH